MRHRLGMGPAHFLPALPSHGEGGVLGRVHKRVSPGDNTRLGTPGFRRLKNSEAEDVGRDDASRGQ